MPSASYASVTPNQHIPNQSTVNPYVIHPSPPPQQNYQPRYSSYTPGGDDYEARRLQPPSNPYVIHPSPSPQESHQPRQGTYKPGGVDHEVRSSPDDLPPVYTSMQN